MTSRAAVEKLQHHHRRLLGGDTAHLPAHPRIVASIPPLSRFHETHFKITTSSSSQAGRGTACAGG
jgi:hypothetical protein